MQKILLFLFCFFSFSLYAQSYSLQGKVADENKQALSAANIVLYDKADSTQIIRGTLSNDSGFFRLENITAATYRLQVDYVGFVPFLQTIKIDKDINLGQISLKSAESSTKEVLIQTEILRAKLKGDTTEYNAKAYKTNPTANVEDLVTKMPGITSENGTLKAQGENVAKVMVDGKEFFGDDATAAMRNLPADIVDKVQVFDQWGDQSFFTGFNDGNTQKTMNIVTRNKQGTFGKVYGGAGLPNNRYNVGTSVNYFVGARRITLLGMSNNVNQQNFAMQDILSGMGGGGGGQGRPMGGGRPGGGGRQGGSPADNFVVGQQNGIARTHALGLNYSDNWGKKVQVAGSYFFNKSNTDAIGTLDRTYFTTIPTQYAENDSAYTNNNNHRFALRLQYKIDSMNTILLNPRINIQDNAVRNLILGKTFSSNNEQINSTQNQSTNANKGINFTNTLTIQHRFLKLGRSISGEFTQNFNQRTGNNSLYAKNEWLSSAIQLLEQEGNTKYFANTIGTNITYTEPWGKNKQLSFSYNPSYNWNKTDKATYNKDSLSQNYSNLDTVLSNNYQNTYLAHKGGIGLRIRGDKYNLSLMANAQYATLTGNETFPNNQQVSKDFINFLPTISLQYKISNKANYRINYRTNTQIPSVSQLQNVVDNSNPLQLSTGNSDLKQAYSHNLNFRYSLTDSKKNTSLFTFISLNTTQNYISNSRFVAQRDTTIANISLAKGTQLTMPTNLNGYYNSNIFLTYSFPIKAIKCNLNLTGGAAYNRLPSFINYKNNFSNTYAPTLGLVLGSNINENIDFNLSYNATYNLVRNTLNTAANNNYFSHSASARLNWIFAERCVLSTQIQNFVQSGLSAGFNQNMTLWSGGFGYKFLKNKDLELKVSVNDILNQNNGIARTVNDTYLQDSQTNNLRRYGLLTLTYTIKWIKQMEKK